MKKSKKVYRELVEKADDIGDDNTIQRMLSNRRYIGELRLRDVVQPNAIPALVSGELVGVRPLHLAAQDRSVA